MVSKKAAHFSAFVKYYFENGYKTEEERNAIITGMAERGIACNVHYKPLPMMTAYKALGFDIANYPNAYNQYANEITLPLHTRLTDEDVEYIITNFVDIISQ